MKDFKHLGPFDYLRIPWKRRWYFLAVTLFVIIGMSAYAFMRPAFYRSETRILVESATLLDDPLSPATARDRTDDRVNAIRQLLESRSILERIVEEFRLRASDTSIPMDDALQGIRTNLEVSKASGSMFTMAYYAPDPQSARSITARLAEILIQSNQNSLKTKAIEKDQFLEQELRPAQQDLAAVDDKIAQFKASHLGELPEQGTAIMEALNGLHSQLAAIENTLDRARDQQKSLEFRLQEQKRLSALAKSLAPKDVQGNADAAATKTPSQLAAQLATKKAQLAEWSLKYEPLHPDIVGLSKEVADLERQLRAGGAQGEGAAITELTPLGPPSVKPPANLADARDAVQLQLSAEAEIAQAQFELEGLKDTIAKREKEREGTLKNIDTYQKKLNLAPALEQELLTLTRDHETKRQQVANLEQRKFNAQMASNAVAAKNNDIYTILDPASLPERPVFPTRLQLILIGIGAGLGAGLAAAFAREYLEPSLAGEEEAAAVLKIPILVCVPEIPGAPRALLK